MKSKSTKDIANCFMSDDLKAVQNVIQDDDLIDSVMDIVRKAKLSDAVFEIIANTDYWITLVAVLENPNASNKIKKRIINSSNSGIYHNEVQQAVFTNDNLAREFGDLILNGKVPGMWSHLDEKERSRRKEVLISSTKSGHRTGVDEWITLGALAEYEGDKGSAEKIWKKKFGPPPTGAELPYKRKPNLKKLDSYASHPMTHRENLVKIRYSNDELLEQKIAHNPSTPPCIIACYAESLFSSGLATLALANPVIPSYVWPWLLAETVDGDYPDVAGEDLFLITAAMNHGLPLEIMEFLAVHPNIAVRRELKNNLCLPDQISKHINQKS